MTLEDKGYLVMLLDMYAEELAQRFNVDVEDIVGIHFERKGDEYIPTVKFSPEGTRKRERYQ
jgi:hypothetical protein